MKIPIIIKMAYVVVFAIATMSVIYCKETRDILVNSLWKPTKKENIKTPADSTECDGYEFECKNN